VAGCFGKQELEGTGKRACDDPRPDAAAGGGNTSLAIGLNDPERARQVFENLAKDGSVVIPLEKTYWAEAFGMRKRFS
jgi:PhnB protein